MIGVTTTIDIYTPESTILYHEHRIDIFLDLLIHKIGMHYAGLSQGGTFPNLLNPEVDDGIIMIKMTTESHIAIRTIPDELYAHIDISSSKSFDVTLAIPLISDFFKTNQIFVNSIKWHKLEGGKA